MTELNEEPGVVSQFLTGNAGSVGIIAGEIYGHSVDLLRSYNAHVGVEQMLDLSSGSSWKAFYALDSAITGIRVVGDAKGPVGDLFGAGYAINEVFQANNPTREAWGQTAQFIGTTAVTMGVTSVTANPWIGVGLGIGASESGILYYLGTGSYDVGTSGIENMVNAGQGFFNGVYPRLNTDFLQQLSTHCFPADTPIQLASGEFVPIQSIGDGDNVASYLDAKFRGRGELESRPVVQLFENITDVFVRLSFAPSASQQDEGSNLVALTNQKAGSFMPHAGGLDTPHADGLDFSSPSANTLTVTPGHHFLDAKGKFRAIADILADEGQIVLADGTLASISGEYLHYSAETANMFEQAEGYVAQSVGNVALAQSAVGGSHVPHASGLVYKKGWKTYNFEAADYRDLVGGSVPTNDNIASHSTKPQLVNFIAPNPKKRTA